jgi:hypothetical protein
MAAFGVGNYLFQSKKISISCFIPDFFLKGNSDYRRGKKLKGINKTL